MATFTNLENAHVFSKAVITPSMSASAAGNTSAHTIQSKDIWVEEAPPSLEESDLSADKEFKIEGYGTVKFHYKKNVYCLTNDNNNSIPSNGYVGKIIDSEGNTISQFISPTDVVNDAGQMATVYQPSLYNSKGEPMPLSDYIINPSNGLIYDLKSTGYQGIFATSAADGRTEYKLSFFTYEGDKLDTTITNIKSSINETKDDLSSHASDTDVHITTSERSKWNTAIQTVKLADNSSDLISVEQLGTTVSVALSNTVATKTDITNLENKITDKTIRINTEGNNITANLTENPNAADSYTISVDGYTTNEIDNKADKIEEQIAIVTAATINTIEANKVAIEDKLSSHASSDIHITASERSIWNTAASKAATAVQDVTSGNAYLERDTNNDNITLTLKVDTNLNDGGTANSVPSSTAVTNYGSSIISTHEAKKDGNKNIHVDDTDRDKWDTAATKAGTAIQTVKRTNDSSNLITVDQSETSVSITLSNTIATKEELSSHTSDTDIHITADERSKWNTASQKTDRLTFPTTYTNFYDNQYYVNSYGFEYVKLIEDAWIQNIEVSVVLPELRDSLTEINLASGSTITPNVIGEKVCKILVAEGLNSDWGDNFNKDDDEIELGTSEYNICEKDKNNSLLVTLNFTFDQPIFLKANKDYRFYFYDRNENPYALPIIVNVDDSNNITNSRKEVASRNLYTRYDYFGVWGNANTVIQAPYAPYGLKVKLSKGIYSAFVTHENNSNIHITENERERWDTVATKANEIEEQIAIVAAATINTIDAHTSNSLIHNNSELNNLFDKQDNITSYYEGEITYSDGQQNATLDLNGTLLAQAAFRTSSSKNATTSELKSFNSRPELIDENGNPTSARWYDDNYASLLDYEMDANAHSVALNESSSLSSLINGSWMFTRSGLKMFNDDINCLMNGTAMFYNSSLLTRFKSALPSLTVGQWMFKGCGLKEFKVKLPSLVIAQGMFAANNNLTLFSSCLPNLTISIDMFLNCKNLTSFIVPPSSLKNLYYARCMFMNCESLTDFSGSLEAMEQPNYMFSGCKLSLDSVNCIGDSIKDCSKGIYNDPLIIRDFASFGIDCTADDYNNSEFPAAIKKITDKGWNVAVQCNGNSTSTLNEIGNTSLIYIKKENLGNKINNYIDKEGNKWTLVTANIVTNPDRWTLLSNLEEAATLWNLTKIESSEE